MRGEATHSLCGRYKVDFTWATLDLVVGELKKQWCTAVKPLGDADIDIVPEKLILNPFREKSRHESGSSSGHPSIEDDVIKDDDDEDDDIDKSASPDSGIQDDSEAEYPDWTELNSTLDIRYWT